MQDEFAQAGLLSELGLSSFTLWVAPSNVHSTACPLTTLRAQKLRRSHLLFVMSKTPRPNSISDTSDMSSELFLGIETRALLRKGLPCEPPASQPKPACSPPARLPLRVECHRPLQRRERAAGHPVRSSTAACVYPESLAQNGLP